MINEFKQFAEACKDDGFVAYEWSDSIVTRGKQTFAVFGSLAYDVTKMKFNYDETCHPGTGKLCIPIKGRYLAQFPDEGQSGIMGMYIINHKGKNTKTEPSFVPCGWLYTSELKLTNNEIKQNIIDDIKQGENVYWPKPAGWV